MIDGVLGLGIAPVTRPISDALIDAVEATCREAGAPCRRVRCARDSQNLGALLLIGLPHYYDTDFDALLAAPHRSRRIAWFGEPLPRHRPSVRARLARVALGIPLSPGLRRGLRGVAARLPSGRGGVHTVVARAWLEREAALNLAAIRRAAPELDLMVTTSHDRGAALAAHGLAARVVPFGYHRSFGGPLTPHSSGPRDLDLLLLGSQSDLPTTRRGDGFRRVRDALEPRHRLAWLEGVWGDERDRLLRRTKILVDIHRVPGNYVGLRLLLGLAAGAVVLSEPMDDPRPFVPGVHYVEAELARFPDEARALLGDPARRQAIVEAGQALLGDQLTMRRSLDQVLRP